MTNDERNTMRDFLDEMRRYWGPSAPRSSVGSNPCSEIFLSASDVCWLGRDVAGEYVNRFDV